MNALTVKVFGWLSDERIDQLRQELKATKEEFPMFSASSLRTGIGADELDKLLTELVARRLKQKAEETRLSN